MIAFSGLFAAGEDGREAPGVVQQAWSDVDRIYPPAGYGAMRNGGIQITRKEGETVNAALFSAGRLNRTGFADEVVNRLRDCLQQSRPGCRFDRHV